MSHRIVLWSICLLIAALPIVGCGEPPVIAPTASPLPLPALPPPGPGPTPVPPTAVAMPKTLVYEDLVRQFDYPAEDPPDFTEVGVVKQGNVTVYDLTFASPRGGAVPAYLVLPGGTGPFPGVVFMHAAGTPREEFLGEATALAGRGIAGLLLAAPHMRTGEPLITGNLNDRDEFVQCALDIRRAVDVLAAWPEVDAGRIGFVGHSYGATLGGILAGVDRRIQAFVLMSGGARLSTWLATMGGSPAYVAGMQVLDPVYYVGHAAPAAILLQNGRQDTSIAEKDVVELYEAASEPKTLRWYDAGHDLNAQARLDRAEWLQDRLGRK